MKRKMQLFVGLYKRDKARGEQGGGDGETTIRQYDEWKQKCAVL